MNKYVFWCLLIFSILQSTNCEQNYDEKVQKLNQEEIDKTQNEENIHRGKGNFSCLTCIPPDCEHFEICHNAVKCYTAHVRDTDGFEHKSKGCTKNRQQTMFHCATLSHDGEDFHKKNNRSAQYAFSCCAGNMCNENVTFPELPPVPIIDKPEELETTEPFSTSLILTIVIPACITMLILVTGVICCMRQNHLKNMDKMVRYPDFGTATDCELAGLRAHAVGDSTLREYQNGGQEASCDVTSGSGSGMPKLTRRTFAKDISLICKIGGGRYGEVWKGTWNGDEVAVKIFNTRDEASFKRETGIYGTTLLRHENILGYYGHDCTSRNSCTQNWLVTQYHRKGSLYDYLNSVESLSSEESFNLIFSALKGLVHLHSVLNGTLAKPQIAHRDIKSKNILVREREMRQGTEITCVLADFGLAVSQKELPDLILTENDNTRVGTKRYMSPEVLSLSILQKQSREIEDFMRSDMYSLALVIWEVLRKTRVIETDPTSAEEFALPYHCDVQSDPSFEEMRKVVCVAQRRPDIPQKWMQNHFMASLSSLASECWRQRPDARLTSQRLQKSLLSLEEECEFNRYNKNPTKPSRNAIVKVPIPSVLSSMSS